MKNTDKTFVFLVKNMQKPLRLVDDAGKVQEAELCYAVTGKKGIVTWFYRVPTKQAVGTVCATDIPLSDEQCEQIKDEGDYLSLG